MPDPGQPVRSPPGRTLVWLLIGLGALACYRLLVLALGDFDLFSDEAYYWGWAQSFDFGYYSKPPLIAWTIMATTAVFGDGELGVKAGTLLIYPVTGIGIYVLGRVLFGPWVGLVAALAFSTLPGVAVSGLIISTDVLLFACWTWALVGFALALRHDRWRDWVLAGTAGGLGLLAKYTMILFPVFAIALLATRREYRHHLRSPRLYTALAIAAGLFLPNVLWNLANGLVSVRHTVAISGLAGQLFHLDELLEFLAGQALLMGPLAYLAWLALVSRPAVWRDPNLRLLAVFSVPFLGTIAVQALLGGANLNWAAPTYVGATLMVVAWGMHARRRWLLILILGINLAVTPILYHYQGIRSSLGIASSRDIDPWARVRGWEQVANEVARLRARHPERRLVMDERNVMARLIYYLEPHPFDARMWNPNGRRSDAYRLDADVASAVGEDFLIIAKNHGPDDLAPFFARVRALAPVQIGRYDDDSARALRVILADDFQGY